VALAALLVLVSATGVARLNARQQSAGTPQSQPAPSSDARATGTLAFQPQGDTYRSPEEPRVPRLSPPGGTHFRTNDEPEHLENDPHGRPIGTPTWTAVGIVSAALLAATALAFLGRPDWDPDTE